MNTNELATVAPGAETLTLDSPEIPVHVRHVYGKETVYPIGPLAATLETLTGCKTLTGRHIAALTKLGFLICDVTPRSF